MAVAGTAVLDLQAKTARFHSDMDKAAKKLNSTTAQMKRSLSGIEKGFQGVQRAAGVFVGVVAAMAAGRGVIGLVKMADAFNQLEAKVRNSVDATTDVSKVMDQLIASSNRTGVAVDGVAQAFARIRPAALELGKTNDDLIRFNETFQKMGALSGATSVEIQQTMIQLSQAIASNRLSGDELRSVLEQMPAVARAIADAMKIPMSDLKAMAKEGKIKAEVVFDAILGKTAEVDEAFSKLPLSVERATVRLQNSFALLVNEINQSTGATNIMATALLNLADWLDRNQVIIIKVTKAIFQMGESAVQAGRIVGGAIVGTVGIVVRSIGTMTGLAIQGIENMINTAIRGINQVIDLANRIPGVNAGGGFSLFRSPGHDAADQFKNAGKAMMTGGFGDAFSVIKDVFSGKSAFSGSMLKSNFGTGIGTKSPYSSVGGEGKGGKAKTEHLPEWFSFYERMGDQIDDVRMSQEKLNDVLNEGFFASDNVFKTMEEYQLKHTKEMIDALKQGKPEIYEQMKAWKLYLEAIAKFPQPAGEMQRAFNAIFDVMPDYKTQLADVITETRILTQTTDNAGNKIANLGNVIETFGGKVSEIYTQMAEKSGDPTELLNLPDIQSKLDQFKDDGSQTMQSVTNAINSMGSQFEDTMTNMLMTGKMSFTDMVNSMVADITRLIIRLSIIQPLVAGLTGLFGGGAKPAFQPLPLDAGITPLSEIQGFASGGSVTGGRPILVGERGPELFVPGGNGSIVPNHQLATAGGSAMAEPVIVQFNINAVDAASFTALVGSNRKLFESLALSAVQKRQNKSGRYGPMDNARA